MNNIKSFKKSNFAPLLVALFIFLRAVLLSDRDLVGFADFYPLTFDFSTVGIVFVCLILLFAVLSAILMTKLESKFGKAGLIISAILVTEPLLFAKQENCINLFIWCIALLFILNALREKTIIPNEITLVVFLFVATILLENALFLYVFPALVFYFASKIDKLFKSTKNLIMLILSAITICAGIVLNSHLVKTYPAFDKFIKEFTFFENVYFKHISYENVLLFIFAIPVFVLGIYFFKEMFKNRSTVSLKKKDKKKTEEVVAIFNPAFAAVTIAVAYIFSVIGFIQAGSAAFCTINYIVPLSMISLLNTKNVSAEKSMHKLTEIIEKHSFVFIVILITLFYFSARVFLADVDNLANFLIMMN